MPISRLRALLLAFALAGCGSELDRAEPEPKASESPANEAEAKAPLPSCPFRSTTGWAGSIEGGRLLVTGRVDLMMAGFRPQLSPRGGGTPGTLALDLALVPQANAGVDDSVRYVRTDVSRHSRGEIWCGGERIAAFDMILVD